MLLPEYCPQKKVGNVLSCFALCLSIQFMSQAPAGVSICTFLYLLDFDSSHLSLHRSVFKSFVTPFCT